MERIRLRIDKQGAAVMIRGGGLLILGALCLGACGSEILTPEPTVPPPPDARPYVEGQALTSLDEAGHFRLPPPRVDGPYATIPPEWAGEIALGVIRSWYANPNVVTIAGATSLAGAAEQQHGSKIDWDRVRAGPRTPFFAESSLEPVPESFGNPTIRHFGPQFLVPLYVDAKPVVVVGVSAYATNIDLDAQGFVHRLDNLDGGGEFRVSGIPSSLGDVAVPPAPELAVAFAAQETGLKITEIPVLGVPGNRVVRTQARWRLRLSAPVALERLADGRVVETDEVYVGLFPSIADARLDPPWISEGVALRMFVASSDQPATLVLPDGELPIRAGYAVDLHEVRLR